MWCKYLRGYAHVRRGLFRSLKNSPIRLVSVSYSEYQQSNECTQNYIFLSGTGIADLINPEVISRNVKQMKLQNFLHCFYSCGWIPSYLMKDIVSDCLEREKFSSQVEQVLLKCCGSMLVTCEKRSRINLTNTVWNHLSRGTDLNLSQYHILLDIDAENSFYRTEVLDDMKKRGLKPNQATYELLLRCASESNHQEAFSNVKSLMERENVSFNDRYLSFQIRLHALQKNLGEIKSIEKTLEHTTSTPSVEIIFALMHAYATLNQYQTSLDLMNRVITSDQNLQSKQVVQLIAELSRNAPKDEVKEFVDQLHLWELTMDIKDIGWLTAYLSSHQLADVAHHFLNKMSWNIIPEVLMDSPPATLVSVASAFWNKDDKPDALLKILNFVENTARVPWAAETALHGALREGNTAAAWIVIEEMYRKNKPLRRHYFSPLLVSASCPGEIFHVIEKMVKLDVTPDVDTLKSYVIKRLLPLGVNQDFLRDRLQKAGLRVKDIVLAFDVYFLETDQIDVALQRDRRHKFEGSLELVSALTNSYLRSPNDKAMIAFMKILQSDRTTKTDWVGDVLLSVYTLSPMLGERLLSNIQFSEIKLEKNLVTVIKALREGAHVEAGRRIDSTVENKESEIWSRIFTHGLIHPVSELDRACDLWKNKCEICLTQNRKIENLRNRYLPKTKKAARSGGQHKLTTPVSFRREDITKT